ncbi:hypothetical protein M9H77_12638 [Catharanthus roseus]|uniref:Uncharacterized protein n=1 Tax=Catharanthus roseus TaxID=4058 RepID=A0ACC0BHX6_CATRO|nr:hypothetical protein M9H77_12638 [Catharanthus roseus]
MVIIQEKSCVEKERISSDTIDSKALEPNEEEKNEKPANVEYKPKILYPVALVSKYANYLKEMLTKKSKLTDASTHILGTHSSQGDSPKKSKKKETTLSPNLKVGLTKWVSIHRIKKEKVKKTLDYHDLGSVFGTWKRVSYNSMHERGLKIVKKKKIQSSGRTLLRTVGYPVARDMVMASFSSINRNPARMNSGRTQFKDERISVAFRDGTFPIKKSENKSENGEKTKRTEVVLTKKEDIPPTVEQPTARSRYQSERRNPTEAYHRRQSEVTKKIGEQQSRIEYRNRERKSNGGVAKIRGNQRVSKTPKDREWIDGSEEESKRLHGNRSSSNKKRKGRGSVVGHQQTARVANPNCLGIP